MVEILVGDIHVDLQTVLDGAEAFGEALLSLAGYKVLNPSSTVWRSTGMSLTNISTVPTG
jgi:hypothetical protein